ncbi:MAG: flagellar biosynthetic protein FliO [Pacificimonas sp.]
MTGDLLYSFFLTMLATAFVLAIAYVFLRVLRRYQVKGALGAGGAAEPVEFVRSLAVGQRERVTVVRFRGELLMLGVTAGGISLLARYEDDADRHPDIPEADDPRPAYPADRDPPSVR